MKSPTVIIRRREKFFICIVGAALGAVGTCVVLLWTGPGFRGPVLQAVAATVATAAFIVALRTFNFNVLKSKADLFNTMHTKLLDADIQKGRACLADLKKQDDVKDLGTDEFRLINRALAHYDTLAMYAIKGDVVREHVVLTWGKAMNALAPKIRWFIARRADVDNYVSWPHLSQLLDELDAELGTKGASAEAKAFDGAALL